MITIGGFLEIEMHAGTIGEALLAQQVVMEVARRRRRRGMQHLLFARKQRGGAK
jgi:hypothetical protein